MTSTPAASARKGTGGPLRWLLDLFSSVWFGVFLLVLLFIFCSIGSAYPPLRMHRLIEMTEFEWFHWWPFDVLVALFTISLTVVTIRRIPLRLVNAGVWTIHTGIIMMVLGSYWYFGTKVEGDTPVFRRRVVIRHPDLKEPAHLLAAPGTETRVWIGPDAWTFAVQSTNTDWPLLSDEHKGEKAYAVNVVVTKPDGETFIRQLFDGLPQYTEDMVRTNETPPMQRAIKAIGRKLFDERLSLALDFEATKHFHVMDTWALYVRRVGETEWHQRPIAGMPRFKDRIRFADQVFSDGTPAVDPIDIEVPPSGSDDPLAGASLRVKAYLRYAEMRTQWRDGGDRANPVLKYSAGSARGQADYPELVALRPERRVSEDRYIELKLLNDEQQLASYPREARGLVTIEVPATGAKFDVPLDARTVVGEAGAWTPIEGTDLSYRVHNVADGLQFEDGSISVAMVAVKTPEGEFTRMVADRPERSRDVHDDSAGGATGHGRMVKELDPRLAMRYTPASPPVTFAALPDGRLFISYNGDMGKKFVKETRAGERISLVDDLWVSVDRYYPRAIVERKPYIVPIAERRRDVGTQSSMIQLAVESSGGTSELWLPYNHYVFESEQYGMGSRFAYTPVTLPLSDGTRVEVVFSRERRELPSPIALDSFLLKTHIGGYTGQADTVRNYVSDLRFVGTDGKWSEPVMIEVNEPTEFGGFWYFQSMWDPPSGGAGTGMNYTGLGVGNRNGVHVQLAGCCLSVAGMIFAFYVKPVIRRRRQEQARARVSGDVEETSAAAPQGAMAGRA